MKLNEISTSEMSVYTNQLFIVMSLILQYPDGSSKLDAHTCQNSESDQFSDCIRCQQACFLYQVILISILYSHILICIDNHEVDRAIVSKRTNKNRV